MEPLLKWGVAVAVAALAAVFMLNPAMHPEAIAPGADARNHLLVPLAVGLVLTALVTDRRKSRRLDQRVRAALEGHSMPYELTWLLLLLVLFLIATLGVSYFAETFLPGVSWEVMMPPVRILFLFVLPLVVVDLGGFTIAGYSTVMPKIAMNVNEPWRWMGLVPGGAVLGLTALEVFPGPVPNPAILIAAAVAIVAAVAVPEEIFFRALLQTRLERILGRWPGILLTTVLFTVVSVFLSEYGDFSSESELFELGPAYAAVFYVAVGLFHGYVWACYRNIWLNVLLRSGVLLMRVLPTLQLL
ncbi:CPBP family intramembrane metalloprotease [Streptomonospora sp. PA3]|nr:CPBP family intramembrane metalloprotease [Streptomonospora sp. PA3]